jgi:hypothetical protein
MCRPATCRKCGKTTRAGCGQHVKQVLAAVPAAERCAGHASATGTRSGRLRQILGRRGPGH